MSAARNKALSKRLAANPVYGTIIESRKQELSKILTDAREELSAIEMEERTREHSALFGRTYKYRNSYSCPETDADYFWLYMIVTGNEDGGLREFKFQTDNRGEVKIERDQWACTLLGGYVEIERVEFDREWKKVLAKLGKVKFPRTRK